MEFHYSVSTKQTVDEAVSTLEQQLKEYKFGLLWDFDLQAKLQEKGVDSYNTAYRILEVCNPGEAAKVLNIDKLAGYFLPCKIVVYDKGGQTQIGMARPTAIIGLLGDPQLEAIAKDIEERLIQAIDKSL